MSKNIIAVTSMRRKEADTNSMVENIEAVQAFNNNQLYTKGFAFGVNPGASNEFSPVLGGKVRFLHGITVYSFDANNAPNALPDTFSLNVNSEVIVDKVMHLNYNPTGAALGNIKLGEYFKLPRPMSGSDSVQINWNAINAGKFYITFWLSDTDNVTGNVKRNRKK